MRETILIITSSIDATSDYMINKYRDQPFFRFDVDRFHEYNIHISPGGWEIACGAEVLCQQDTISIYYRKPMLPDLSGFESTYQNMIQRDIISVITGIADSFSGCVLTRPSILRATENKAFQLLTAADCGLAFPKSYMGTSRTETEQFCKKPSIIKPISTGKVWNGQSFELFHTERFLSLPDDLSMTPVYLQDYEEKQYEVRLTIVGDSVFPVRIDCDNKLDWRRDYASHRYEMIDLPQKIKSACMHLLQRYHLSFGAFDFIVSPSNDWLFLEVNPNGQWLWLERALGLGISNAILRLLLNR